jgi:nucleoside-diphosphate-sugar epimerase
MAKERGRSGDIYNVSAKDFKTQNEFLQIVSKYLNVEPPKKHVSAFSAKMSSVLGGSGLTSEYIDKIVRNRTYDLTKAKNELGFEPKVDMDACIKEMTEDFLNRVEEEQKQVAEEKSEEQS